MRLSCECVFKGERGQRKSFPAGTEVQVARRYGQEPVYWVVEAGRRYTISEKDANLCVAGVELANWMELHEPSGTIDIDTAIGDWLRLKRGYEPEQYMIIDSYSPMVRGRQDGRLVARSHPIQRANSIIQKMMFGSNIPTFLNIEREDTVMNTKETISPLVGKVQVDAFTEAFHSLNNGGVEYNEAVAGALSAVLRTVPGIGEATLPDTVLGTLEESLEELELAEQHCNAGYMKLKRLHLALIDQFNVKEAQVGQEA